MIDRVHIVGCGSVGNGDDCAGLEVARLIRDRQPGWRVTLDTTGGANALEWSCSAETLIVIDAAEPNERLPAGEFHRIDFRTEPKMLDQIHWQSTHAMSVATGLKLLEAIGELPRRVIVYALGAERVERGSEPSPKVVDTIRQVASRVIHEVKAILETKPCTSSV